jgi:hypothetical protein
MRCTTEFAGRVLSSWTVLRFDEADAWHGVVVKMPTPSTSPRIAANLVTVTLLRLMAE